MQERHRTQELKPNFKPNDLSTSHHPQKQSENKQYDSQGYIEAKLNTQLAKLRIRIAELQDQNLTLQKQRIQESHELEMWIQKARRLTQQLREAQSAHLAFVFQQKKTSQQMQLKEQIQKELVILSSLNNQLEKDLIQEKKVSQQLRFSIKTSQEIEGELEQSKELLNAANLAIKELSLKARKDEQYIRQLSKQFQQSKQQLEQKLYKMQEMEKQLQQQKEKNKKLNEDVTYLTQTRQRLTKQLSLLKQDNHILSQNLNQIQSLMLELQKQQSLSQTQHNQKNIFSPTKTNLQITNINPINIKAQPQTEKNSSNQMSSLLQKIGELQKKIEEKQRLLLQAQNQRDNIFINMKSSDRENDKLKESNQELKVKVMELQSIQKQLKARIPLQRRLFEDQNKSYYRQANQNSQNQHKNINYLQKVIKQLREQNKDINIRLERTEKELEKTLSQTTQMYRISQEIFHLKQEKKVLEKLIAELKIQNQKWKSYRLSEEDEARREARKYKEIADHAQEKFRSIVKELEDELREKDMILAQAQIVCQKMKINLLEKEEQCCIKLEKEKQILNCAMDDMEVEFRNMMKDCELKVHQKSIQSASYLQKIEVLTGELQQAKSREKQIARARQQIEEKNKELIYELTQIQKEVYKIQGFAKKQQSTKSLITEVQEEVRKRYEKSIQEKIHEIQRLKLLLQEEERELSLKGDQLQQRDDRIKGLEAELTEQMEGNKYLQKITSSYQGEIKFLKKNKQEVMEELEALKEDKKHLKIVQRQMQTEQQRNQRLIKQNNGLYSSLKQSEMKVLQLKQKIELISVSSNRDGSEAQLRENNLRNQLKEMQKTIQQQKGSFKMLKSQCCRFETELISVLERQKNLREEFQQKEGTRRVLQNKLSRLQLLQSEDKQYIQTLKGEKKKQNKQLEGNKQCIQNLLLKQQQSQFQYQELQKEIQGLLFDKNQKDKEINFLLQKIDRDQLSTLETNQKILQNHKMNHKVFLELEKLTKVTNLPMKDEGETIRLVREWAEKISLEMNIKEEELQQYKKVIVKLREEKQTASQKYLKYKGIAIELKEKREHQKLMIKNSYRFNEEVLTHCQDIIKGTNR